MKIIQLVGHTVTTFRGLAVNNGAIPRPIYIFDLIFDNMIP